MIAESIEGESTQARLNRYRLFDEVNARYIKWQLSQFEPFLGRRVLEVGCGVGSILAQLSPKQFVMGIDIEPNIVDYTRARFAGRPAFEFANLDISRLSHEQTEALRRRRFDSIVCINVLEHVEDDRAAMRAMADIVEPGGSVGVLVPAHPLLYGAYDAMEGHFRRYNRRVLRELISSAGLDLTTMYRLNMLGAAGWFVQYKLLRRRIHGRAHFKVLQSVLPVMQAIESRVRPPVGLSLVAIAHKRPS